MVPSSYRVELRQPRRTRVLDVLTGVTPHFRALDLYVSRMCQDGVRGWVVLVDTDFNRVVAKRRVPTILTHR